MSLNSDPVLAKYFPDGVPPTIEKYFPNGIPQCWREKFPEGTPLSIFKGLKGQEINDKIKEIFGGELPEEFLQFKDGIPEDLKELAKNHIVL